MNKKKKIIIISIIVGIFILALIIALILSLNISAKNEESEVEYAQITEENQYTEETGNIDIESEEEDLEDEDTVSPIIVLDSTYIVQTGYEKNLVDVIMSADDTDSTPTREIIGEYDLNTQGEYELTYKITDSSGNETTKEFTLKVIDDYTYSEEDEITFEDAIDTYKTEDTKIGIDVSKWQSDIDWEEVAQAGAEFAIIRVAYQNGFDGDIIEDPYFLQNMEGCSENNIPVSVYFSSYAQSADEAKQQADWVCNLLSDYNYDNINIAFDWENWTSFNTLNISLNELNDMADTFMEECINKNYKTRLYSSKTYLENVWKNNNDYPVWLANYVSQTSYTGDYSIWQFCQTGTINGISGYVDINVAYINN